MADKVQQLQQQFPDMSQSMLGDILTTYQHDTKKAAEVLRNIDEETKREQKAKLKELKEMFPALPQRLITQCLEEAKGDVETAIIICFNKSEETKQQEKKEQAEKAKRKKEEEEKRKRAEEAKQKAAQLLEIFHTIPQGKIQELLDENEGDIEDTTNALLLIVGKQEADKQEAERKKKEEAERLQKEQERRLRDLKVQALSEKFDDLSEAEVVTALETAQWDIKGALAKLLSLSADKKKAELKQLFPAMTSEEVENALDANNYDKSKALQALINLERTKREQEEKRKAQQQLEQEKKKVEVAASVPTPAPKKEEGSVVIKKVRQNFLERSIVLGQKLEDEITASQIQMKRDDEQKSEVAKQLFKEDLEHIIATQARFGTTPGLAPPPLPKQIDVMLGKKKPIEDSEHDVPQAPALQAPVQEPPVKQDAAPLSASAANNNSSLSLKLTTPTVCDVGSPLTVEFEVLHGTTTAYDWIGLFSPDQPNKQYHTYQWRGKDEKKGTVTFTAPTVYGEYEFRYFPNGSYEHAAMSNRVRVGPQFNLEARLDAENKKVYVKWSQLSGNSYSRAWIGFFEKSQTNNKQYLAWDYAVPKGAAGNELCFEAPVKPQQYEFRLFANSYVDVARSNPIVIEGQDSITASYDNGTISLKLNIVSVDPYYETAWVGVYFVTETNNRQWRRYKYLADRSTDVQFKAPRTPGEYEVRLFANKSYDLLLKSNSFTIPTRLAQ